MGRFSDWLRGHNPSATTVEEHLDGLLRELDMFADASLQAIHDRYMDDPAVRQGIVWYLVGASEALSDVRGLDGDGAAALAYELLRRRNLATPALREAIIDRDKVARAGQAHEARAEGRQTLGEWVEGKDNNAPLRLAQLVRDWTRPR